MTEQNKKQSRIGCVLITLIGIGTLTIIAGIVTAIYYLIKFIT